jgi:hypothetical protein
MLCHLVLSWSVQCIAKICTSVHECDSLFKAAIAVGANTILICRDLVKFEGAQFLVIASADWTGDMVFELPEETQLFDLSHPGGVGGVQQ